MKAVILAAALLAAASGGSVFAAAYAEGARTTEPVVGESSSSLRKLYRADRAACAQAENRDRACERRARERLHARIKKEAARLALR